MRYDSRMAMMRKIKTLKQRWEGDDEGLVRELAKLVVKAYKEGETEGQRRERRRAGS